MESITTVISIVIGFSVVIIGLMIQMERLRGRIREQDGQIAMLKNIIIEHWPGERVRLTVTGNVTDSNIGASGRDSEGR